MSLGRFLEQYGKAIVLVTITAAAAGIIAGGALPSDIYPPLVFPRVVVIAHAGPLPAPTMMLTVTRPIEQALMEVPGVRRVRSTTFRGATEISAQFDPSVDMVVALQQAQGRVAEIRGQMPGELELIVERLTPAAFPFLSLNLSGGLSPADLHDYAFYAVRPELARVAGVGRVEVLSSDTREIEVIVDPAKLASASLTVAEVADALKATNELTPVGRYEAGGLQHLVLASGLWRTPEDIAQTPVVVRQGATIRVADIAQVERGAPDRTALVSGGGRPSAVISVSQQIGANMLEVRRGIDATLGELVHRLPSGLTLTRTYDLAEFVATAIANVRDAILIGGFLAIIVLLVFLRNWRLTLVASVTLPLTVLMTLLVMKLLGESINVMSMGGLAVAIGLVIDDAVVIVEGVHRHLLQAESPGDAVSAATAELIAPVVGSTLTTVVVFLPLGFLSGVVGQFFRALSLTLSAAVLISLLLALTLIPVLARRLGRVGHAGPEPGVALERAYVRAVRWVRPRPGLAIAATVLLLAGVVGLSMLLGTGFLPEADEGGFIIDYRTPPGSSLAESDRELQGVESVLKTTPDIAAFSRRTGTELGLFATQQNKGDILVRLRPAGDRRPSDEVIEDLRAKLTAAAPQIQIEFVQLLQDMIGDLEGNPTPIEVKIFGDDPDRLAAIGDRVEPVLAGVPGVVDVVGVQRGNPEATWEIDPVSAGRFGLTIQQVSDQLSTAWLGEVATDLRQGDRAIPVRVRLPDAYRLEPQRMAETPIRAADGRTAPLSAIARVSITNGQTELMRENLRQMTLLTARLEGRDLGGAVADLRAKLARVTLPVGYTMEVGGQYAAQRQSFREMLIVFGTATALVFLILVIQFHRFVPALLILLAAPLSLSGAFLLLLVTGIELNVSSAMGLILLVGLVVKNGIVLIDYAHRMREDGMPLAQALEEAARIRLRPILMTTLCTLFGLLPLALGLGAGAELQRPLAVAVIGGLSLSTVVTLLLVPTAYAALGDRRAG